MSARLFDLVTLLEPNECGVIKVNSAGFTTYTLEKNPLRRDCWHPQIPLVGEHGIAALKLAACWQQGSWLSSKTYVLPQRVHS